MNGEGAAAAGRTLALPELPLISVEVEARALADAPLPPYLGATLRGSLGRVLRETACVTGAPTCAGCAYVRRCAYGVTWEAPTPAELDASAAVLRGEWPRPYVIGVERTPERVRRGSTIRFRLSLIGSGRLYLAQYLVCLADALRRGIGPRRTPFEVVRATTLGYRGGVGAQGAGVDGRGLVLMSDGVVLPWEALPDTTLRGLVARGGRELGGRLRIAMVTPMHVRVAGRMMEQLSLEPLVRRLAERIDRFSLAWGMVGQPLLDFEGLAAMARRVRVVSAESRRVAFERRGERAGRVPMEGIVGRFVVDGVEPALGALVAAATWVHVGKQATFGFGRLRVEGVAAT